MKKAIALTAFLASCAPAYAQQYGALPLEFCSTTTQVEQILTNQYNEAVRYEGVKSPVLVERLWVNDQTGTYSFTRTNIQENITCVISAGNHGQVKRPKPNL